MHFQICIIYLYKVSTQIQRVHDIRIYNRYIPTYTYNKNHIVFLREKIKKNFNLKRKKEQEK